MKSLLFVLLLGAAAFAAPPLYFEPNQGQADPAVRFLARGGGATWFLTSNEAILQPGSSSGAPARMRLLGSRAPDSVQPLDPQPGVSNYLIGNDSTKWRRGINHYARVRFRNVYPGIDLVYYGDPDSLEYDFILAPGADPRSIRIAWDGVRSRRLTAEGNLTIETKFGAIVQKRPRVFQQIAGHRRVVPARYRLLANREIAFRLASYDRGHELIIDPGITYSTYVGGSGSDVAYSVALDSSLSPYIAGVTTSANYPVNGSALGRMISGPTDAFVSKLDSFGSTLLYSTFLGGSQDDQATAITADEGGNAYVTGTTSSPDFPLQNNLKNHLDGPSDAFLTKLNPNGTGLIFSTYLGGASDDHGTGIARDDAGSVYVGGWTGSSDFPTTTGAFQTQFAGATDGFVTKVAINFNGLGTISYSTFLGGAIFDRINGLAVDGAGSAYVVGETGSSNFPVTPGAFQTTSLGRPDAFIAKLNLAGSGLSYSTLLGGTDFESGTSIAVDPAGRASVTGVTTSRDFPATAGAYHTQAYGGQDIFVARFNSAGNRAVYSTLIGGKLDDTGSGIQVDAAGNAYLIGYTNSIDYPFQLNAIQIFNNGLTDAVFSIFNPTGSTLVYTTHLGGFDNDFGRALAIDSRGITFLVGSTRSNNFPTTGSSFQTTYAGGEDSFVTKVLNFDLFLESCIAAINASPGAFPSGGGQGAINVNGECVYTGVSSAAWAAISPPVSGQNVGTLNYAVAANPDPNPRVAAISVAGNIVSLIQSGTGGAAPFTDVPPGHPYVNHIQLIKNAAITSGCTPSAYCPESSTTRGQMAVFIIRALLGGDAFPYPDVPYFSDVRTTDPYFKWIQKMRELGITAGCSQTRYCPNDPVTRGQMAVFLLRARIGDNFDFSNSPYYSDVPATHPYFLYVQKMKEFGVTTGCTATQYCPDDPVTRGQMAVFLTRTFLTPW